MRTLKILSLSALALVTIIAMSSMAIACDKTAKAETADAKTASASCSSKSADATTADAKVASTGCASKASATTADAKVAGTGCSSAAKGATATVAGTGCSSKAATADAKVAGAGCSKSAEAGMPSDMAVEAVRMPSGALAVFYTGSTDATIAGLQAKAAGGAENFGCNLAGSMAKDESCNVEVAKISNGVMMLVSSEKADVLDEFQKQYEVATAMHSQEQGEE